MSDKTICWGFFAFFTTLAVALLGLGGLSIFWLIDNAYPGQGGWFVYSAILGVFFGVVGAFYSRSAYREARRA
jgi:hypothetical protein